MFWNKQRIIYGPFLKGAEDVVGKEPGLVEHLANDIDLELYLGDSSLGKNTWVTAVLSVTKGGKIYKSKYEGGSLKKDGLQGMADACIFYIMHSYGLDSFREMVPFKF